MANKKTKKDYFAEIYSIVEKANVENKVDILGFIDHQVELLEKKSSSKTMTKTQKENEDIKASIVAYLEDVGEPVTITDIIAKADGFGDYTNQKISALMSQLVKAGAVERVEKGKKTYFKAIAD
jgi:hypothetical protein